MTPAINERTIMCKKAVSCILSFLIFLSSCSSVPDSTTDEKEVQNIENPASIDTAEQDIPNYYHSVSDADESGIYLGGVGGIYRMDSEAGVQTLYSSPHIAGAALYGDYVFALEDLWFRQRFLSDSETMSYNHAWDGTFVH